MKKKGFILIAFGFLAFLLMSASDKAVAQNQVKRNIVEISGVVLSSDSIHPVPNAVITVLHKNRGVLSNNSGIYSLVCYPGDTLVFSSVGYRTTRFTLPTNFAKSYYNHVAYMPQDTFYLPETTIHALPTGDAFVYAFKYWPQPVSLDDIAMERFSRNQINMLRATLPMSGPENQTYYQNQQFINTRYMGQVRTGADLLNPLKWKDFIDAWKRGDFRKDY